MKKYEFTGEKIDPIFGQLHEIVALRDFSIVKKGDIGGWIEREENLSHEGDCWVSDNACVYGNARVSGNALVSGNSFVYGNARVSDNARVYGNDWVSGNARVSGNALVYENAFVSGGEE